MSSSTDKISGKVKQAGGKLTDNKKLQAKGKAQELKGKAEKTVDSVKDKIERKTK
jgi:uncharacterized protein YjbJ (UPF0337 family)